MVDVTGVDFHPVSVLIALNAGPMWLERSPSSTSSAR